VPDVLWITPIPPDRRGGGGHVRQAYLLLALAERARIHLICSQPVQDPAIRDAVASLTEFDLPEPGSGGRSRWARRARDLWLATLGRQPQEVAGARAVRKVLRPVLADLRADAAIVEYAALAPLGAALGQVRARVLTLHNVASVMAAQHAAVEPGRRQRWLYRRDAHKAAAWEGRVQRAFDKVVTVSEDDAAALGGPGARFAVVPNGVDVDRYRVTELPAGPRLVFTGALYTLPNRDGILWFCHEVFPLIKRERPDASLAVVGLRPWPDIRALGEMDGVSVIPDVDDTSAYLAEARVAVVPLRIGSGTRLKVLEAMSSGRPVVGTSIGVEGLGAVDGKHVSVADDPVAFAAAVLRLVSDDSLAGALVAEGRRLVEERFAWPRIQEQFVEELLRTAGGTAQNVAVPSD
jgi:glycosyltransferase involved in cell wall biosynthesis